MELTNLQRQKLINSFPYLQLRNLWSGKLVENCEYIVGDSIPEGWFRLFLLYCKNIKSSLEKSNYIDEFMFTDVKEKYGTLRLSNNGEPSSTKYITYCYESFSKFVCQHCGSMADRQTEGWIMSLCNNCLELLPYTSKTVKLPKQHVAKIIQYSNNESKELQFSLRRIEKEYQSTRTLSQDEFIDYVVS